MSALPTRTRGSLSRHALESFSCARRRVLIRSELPFVLESVLFFPKWAGELGTSAGYSALRQDILSADMRVILPLQCHEVICAYDFGFLASPPSPTSPASPTFPTSPVSPTSPTSSTSSTFPTSPTSSAGRGT